MSHDQSITLDELRDFFSYDPETGELFWKVNRGMARAGSVAGSLHPAGYILVGVKRKLLRIHRVIWAICYGRWPVGDIDHINGDRADNRIANLREATRQENLRNSKKSATNASGVTGVFWQTRGRRWIAVIGGPGTRTYHYLGCFENFEDAVAARKAAEAKENYSPLHGEDEAVRWLLG
jgi:hypothetical protein